METCLLAGQNVGEKRLVDWDAFVGVRCTVVAASLLEEEASDSEFLLPGRVIRWWQSGAEVSRRSEESSVSSNKVDRTCDRHQYA